uniref:Sorting nexin/Vps5-like C-terminal domain-containing protein n=1 Tax=Buteo japonicus TaxID=224669 RepID=A0A8C0B1V2_9AVES
MYFAKHNRYYITGSANHLLMLESFGCTMFSLMWFHCDLLVYFIVSFGKYSLYFSVGKFRVAVGQRSLSANTAAFAKSAAMLSNSEDHTALSRALSQLAEVEEKIDQLHQEQAFADFYVFSELFGDYIRLIAAVKGVFDHRMKCWQKWQDAQVTLQKKHEAEAKLQLANRPDKLQQAKDDIKEWETKVQQGEKDFEQVSKTIREEVQRFERERVKDFKTVIIKYLESLVQTQQQLIKYWEAFLPEAKSIA